MHILYGDIWDQKGSLIVVPTNMTVDIEGLAVCGRGVAHQAAEKFPTLRADYGSHLLSSENGVLVDRERKLIMLPVKRHWREKADLSLIADSLRTMVPLILEDEKVALPLIGCGFGELRRNDVLPLLEALDDRFTLILRTHEVGLRYPVSFRDGVRVDRSKTYGGGNDGIQGKG